MRIKVALYGLELLEHWDRKFESCSGRGRRVHVLLFCDPALYIDALR
jgi:hypothetical protein